MTSDFYIVTAVTEIPVFCGFDAIRFGTDMTVLKKQGASIFRTDIEREVEVEVDVPTRVRVQYGAMTECDSICVAMFRRRCARSWRRVTISPALPAVCSLTNGAALGTELAREAR